MRRGLPTSAWPASRFVYYRYLDKLTLRCQSVFWRADRPIRSLGRVVLLWADAAKTATIEVIVEEGDGVLLLAHNHPQTLMAWLALLQCGARILPVNPQLPRHLLEVLLPQMTLRFALAARRRELQGMHELAQTSELVAQVGQLIHELQKERGRAALLVEQTTEERRTHWLGPVNTSEVHQRRGRS